MSPNVDSSVEMHVAIASGAPSLIVSVSGNGKLFDQNGTPLQTLKAGPDLHPSSRRSRDEFCGG
ncbi:MAG: hypothetical protein HC852_00935 [Acaryochloridaceae cyanobacterium RU_4_10]|nr:hypothetical protein [Acaryochloridaceae cyanobacterium RU_4_10]